MKLSVKIYIHYKHISYISCHQTDTKNVVPYNPAKGICIIVEKKRRNEKVTT